MCTPIYKSSLSLNGFLLILYQGGCVNQILKKVLDLNLISKIPNWIVKWLLNGKYMGFHRIAKSSFLLLIISVYSCYMLSFFTRI